MIYFNDNIWYNKVATDLYAVGFYFTDETNDFVGPYDCADAAIKAASAYVLTLG